MFSAKRASLVAQLVKNPPAMWETCVLIPGLRRSPGEGKACPLQDSGLENSMDCIVHGVAKSQTRLSDFQYTNTLTGTARNNVYQLSGLP